MIFAGIISGIASAILVPLASVLRTFLASIGTHPLLISLLCDVIINVLYFAVMMASFVLGILSIFLFMLLMMWIVYKVF